MERRSIAPGGPVDLRRTLRPLHGRFEDDGWWFAARTPDGPGSIRVRRDTDSLVGEAWGDGSSWLLDRLADMTGLGDDPSRFMPSDPMVAELHRKHPGLRFARTGLVFQALLPVICAQKVTGTEARRAYAGLHRRFSEPAPGPNPRLRLPPDPERMAAAPYWEFHGIHLEKRRADIIRRVSRHAAEIHQLIHRSTTDATTCLRRYHGIGAWTAAGTFAVSHGDPDQVPVGDYHMKHIVVHHLTGRDRGTDEEMLQLLEPFRPDRGRVIRLLHTLGHEPKFGPRSTPRNITRM